MIYFDHAATSWPKPQTVVDAVVKALTEKGANPGRGNHRMALDAGRIILQTRMKLAKLIGAKNPNQIILTKNTTEALNLAIFGFLREDDHVICTSIEHNSVRRPLAALAKSKNISITFLDHDRSGSLDYTLIKQEIKRNTKLLIATHGSNVLGSILDLNEVANALQGTGVKFAVDAAQTIGTMPIHIQNSGIDMLAFPGHKALLGPQGTGGLYVSQDVTLEPLLYGGTGSRAEDVDQPKMMPEGYEAGTINTPGFAGLSAALDTVLKEDLNELHLREWKYTQLVIEELNKCKNMRSYGPTYGVDRCGLVTFTHSKLDASELAYIFDQHYGMALRSGYHCSPMAHQLAETIKTGAVRASFGSMTTLAEIDQLLLAIREIDATV